MNDDLKELLESLKSHEVEFLVIGAHAVAFHLKPRFTEDVDLWVGRSLENARRLAAALDAFGAPIGGDGAQEFAEKDRQMIRLGGPPNMADLLNFAGDWSFDTTWENRIEGDFSGIRVFYPSKEDLIAMKLSSGRPQDLVDVENLRKAK